MRRFLGGAFVAAGLLVALYAAAVVVWRDPATDLYTRWRQHELSGSLRQAFAEEAAVALALQRAVASPDRPARHVRTEEERLRDAQLAVAEAANRLHRKLRLGKPLGRIRIPKLELNAVFVHGTRWGPDLSQGPGHYPQTSLPGVGRTMAIAGHRTTFGAPFRHIDSLRSGDRISLELPYASFHYRVFRHTVVDDEDWSIVRDRGFDTLVLSACHPLYSAARRWAVFARLVRVDPVGGPSYALARSGRAVALRGETSEAESPRFGVLASR